jgi:calcineurin-like phosphoesterase
MKKEIALHRFLTQMDRKLEVAEGEVEVDAVLIELDSKGKAKKIKRLETVVE